MPLVLNHYSGGSKTLTQQHTCNGQETSATVETLIVSHLPHFLTIILKQKCFSYNKLNIQTHTATNFQVYKLFTCSPRNNTNEKYIEPH